MGLKQRLWVGIRERWFEDIVKRALRRIILVQAHPRSLVQVTLLVVATPLGGQDGTGDLAQADSVGLISPAFIESISLGANANASQNLPLLPALLQASMLALLSTSIPLSMTLTSTLIAVDFLGQLVQDPSVAQLREAESVHVFAFSSRGDLLLVESEGEFDIVIWGAAMEKARLVCGAGGNDGGDNGEDVDMEGEEGRTLADAVGRG